MTKILRSIKKKPNPYSKKIVVTFKVNSEEMRTLLSKSHGFTGGNVSAWVRYASFNFKPSKDDFEK